MCVIFQKANASVHTDTHTQESDEKCVKSPSICVTYVQYMRILMDHKGVCAGAGPRALVQGSTHLFLSFFSFFLSLGPVNFVD